MPVRPPSPDPGYISPGPAAGIEERLDQRIPLVVEEAAKGLEEAIEEYKESLGSALRSFHGSWKASNWTQEQFMELIEPLLALKSTVSEMGDWNVSALPKIAGNWGLPAAHQIKAEVQGTFCLRRIALVSALYKDRYLEARKELNYWII